MFLMLPSAKIFQTVPVGCTVWPPEPNLYQRKKTFKRFLFIEHWMNFYIISQKRSLRVLYRNCSNGSVSLHMMATGANNYINNKHLNNFFLLLNAWLLKLFHQNVSYSTFCQMRSDGSASLHSMTARAKYRRKKIFQRLLSINHCMNIEKNHKCFQCDPLQKLRLKQTCRSELKPSSTLIVKAEYPCLYDGFG